jgi:nucleoside-diphosphate-sugar epimerase
MPSLTLIAGCGYLGTALAREIQASGGQILGLTHRQESAAALTASGIPALACDLSHPASVVEIASQVQTANPGDPLHLVHCAASGRGGRAAQYRAVYLEGCRNLRAAFPGAARFFFTSSTSVYPHIGGEIVTETTSAHPDRETGQILRETEEETLAAGGMVGRLAGIYGPDRSVLLKNFLAGQSVIDVRTEPPATPDGRWINQIHVQDAARAIFFLLQLPDPAAPRLWNIADSTPLLQRPLFTRLCARFNRPLPPDAPPDLDRKRGWTHKRVSNAKLLATGWQSLYPDWFTALDEGGIMKDEG